jgi:phenylacetate-CoA ligase
VPRCIDHDVQGLLLNAIHGERERAVLKAVLGQGHGFREMVLVSPLGSAVQSIQELYRRKLWLPRKWAVRRQYLSIFTEPRDLVRAVAGFRPDVLYSYGSCLEILFGWLKRTGGQLEGPRVAVYTSDGMSSTMRRIAEKDFGISVLSIYGAAECLKIGFECESHTGLHINEDIYPVSIVDEEGRQVPPGTTGQVIVSNLVNRATVLLNYRVGDEAAWQPDPCACGRKLPLLSFTQGRVGERVRLPNGRLLHPLVFAEVLYSEPELWQHQAVQNAQGGFEVKLVVDPRADRSAMALRLASGFRKWFRKDIAVELKFVDEIPRTDSGKLKAVILDNRWVADPCHGTDRDGGTYGFKR